MPEMYTRLELMTPERAQHLLSTNTNPRGSTLMTEARAIARDMAAGNYEPTHQGIAISVEGKLLDGFTRLTAITIYGEPIRINVTYNAPNNPNIDGGRTRRPVHRLNAAGFGGNGNRAIAIARIIQEAPRHVKGKPTTQEYIHLLTEKYGEAIRFAADRADRNPFTAASRCVIARAYFYADQERLLEWIKIIHTGFTCSRNQDDDSAAIAYRNFLLKNNRVSGSSMELDRYLRGQWSLDRFLRRMRTLCAKIETEDLFPFQMGTDQSQVKIA